MLKPIKRAVHFDFHTMPGIDDFGENFSAEELAKQLKDAHVEYINMFARCNIGYSYYPTKIGVPYPNMKGNLLGDVVRECHKVGIGVSGYINVGLNHEGLVRHPEWLKVNKDYKVYNMEKGPNFFRLPCFNTSYVDYLIEEIKEIIAEGVDGIFCDIMNLYTCYCPKCRREMNERGMDPDNENDANQLAADLLLRTAKRIREVVPKDKYLFFNSMPFQEVKDIQSHIEIECLPAVSIWGYDYFTARAALARPINSKILYMNGRFQRKWGDFGGYKGKASIENDFYDALLNGCTTSLGDHLHPSKGTVPRIINDVKDMYERIEKYEKWTEGAKYRSEIAVLMNARMITKSHEGLSRLLSELKYGFDIVMTDGDFSKYPLVIMPDDITVDENLAKKLKDYLKAGGKVISTGTSGLTQSLDGFALPEWDFEYEGKDPCNVSYYNTDISEISGFDWNTYSQSILVKAKEGNTTLANHVTAYFNFDFDGLHYYYYTPPKKATGYAAALVNGAENVAHVSFPLFNAYLETMLSAHKILIKNLIERFMPDNAIKADELPITSRASVTDADGYSLFHVKVTYPEIRKSLGIIEEHNVLPAGRCVGIKGKYQSACRLPDETPIKSEIRGDYTYVTLPEITGYDMFLLKK